jgi:hypothetical protein
MSLDGSAYEPGGERAGIRAADVDRDHVAGLLSTAYAEGRLSKDEYDDRLASAYGARTYGELDQIVADLPVPAPSAQSALVQPQTAVPAVAKLNGAAQASFLFGIAQIMIGPFGTIPAIVLGHMARNQIKRTGERGAGLATTGLVLGWGALILGVVIFIVTTVALSNQGYPTPGP